MAVMYPQSLPDETRSHPQRSAECKVFDALQGSLPDEYHVFYSSPWLGITPLGEEIDGEVDFTVAHPKKGLLTIEVKGGRVEIENTTRTWYSTDRNDWRFIIKNPVEQARSGKHNLLAKLKDSTDWRPRFIRARHSVLLPDVLAANRDLGPDMPLNIFGFSDDMDTLHSWIEKRMGEDPQESSEEVRTPEELGSDGIAALIKLLTRGIKFQPDIRGFVREDVRRIEYLSTEQYQIIDTLMANRGSSQAVGGAAGTGKTIIALQAASMLAEDKESVLLVCYNSPLRKYLSDATNGIDGVEVHTFDSLLRSMTEAAQIPTSDDDDKARLFLEASDSGSAPRFDNIIVDEGQDFEGDWLEVLELLLSRTSGHLFTVFYDSNQRLYNRSIARINMLERVRIPLRRNFRNTKKILELAKKFYENPEIPIIPSGPDGEDVGFFPCKEGEEIAKIRILLGKLITEQGFPPDDIAVLFQTAKIAGNATEDGSGFGRFPTTTATQRNPGAVVVDSIRRFKGLESDVVIICITQADQLDQELMYVASTRARGLLWIIGPRGLEGSLAT